MGRPFDRRVDQYALAMTVHEVLSGTNCMSGGTPSATMVNQTMVVPPPLDELVPEIPPQLSDAIARRLSKDPEDRFESCTALAHEVLEQLPAAAGSAATMIGSGLHPSGTQGQPPVRSAGVQCRLAASTWGSGFVVPVARRSPWSSVPRTRLY